MSFISNLLSGGAGELVKTIGNVADELVTTKEEKLQMELELKKADYEYQTTMLQLSNDEKKMYFDDTSSARKMAFEVQTSANSTPLNKNVPSYLALGTTIATFTLFTVLFFNGDKIEATQKDIIIYILGVLSAILTQIFSFYFGSSQGSADKSKVIEGVLAKSNPH